MPDANGKLKPISVPRVPWHGHAYPNVDDMRWFAASNLDDALHALRAAADALEGVNDVQRAAVLQIAGRTERLRQALAAKA